MLRRTAATNCLRSGFDQMKLGGGLGTSRWRLRRSFSMPRCTTRRNSRSLTAPVSSNPQMTRPRIPAFARCNPAWTRYLRAESAIRRTNLATVAGEFAIECVLECRTQRLALKQQMDLPATVLALAQKHMNLGLPTISGAFVGSPAGCLVRSVAEGKQAHSENP
jgi:hypothetical protein